MAECEVVEILDEETEETSGGPSHAGGHAGIASADVRDRPSKRPKVEGGPEKTASGGEVIDLTDEVVIDLTEAPDDSPLAARDDNLQGGARNYDQIDRARASSVSPSTKRALPFSAPEANGSKTTPKKRRARSTSAAASKGQTTISSYFSPTPSPKKVAVSAAQCPVLQENVAPQMMSGGVPQDENASDAWFIEETDSDMEEAVAAPSYSLASRAAPWKCDCCGEPNEASRTTCVVCRFKKGAKPRLEQVKEESSSPSSQASSGVPNTAAPWECPFCREEDIDGSVIVCPDCDEPKPAEARREQVTEEKLSSPTSQLLSEASTE
eukprot:3602921-Rhodomonas_salina.1